ncbi:ABC transporter substrate-binding protein [uncultured Cohaesibacter sp.]|uniref:ABC transporter substrate-binding protein n=1 Tax=uncultured Cohaesibacter sp. TaxID=1002546 RepID=UPI002931D601|nr:ABC transporter substrate-binding protein [uncultured Cohaesibacter sp.]
MIKTGLLTSIGLGLMLSTSAYAFQEAPILAEMVKAGQLPPVEERLPEKPTVVKALSVGQYGGVWKRAFKGPGDRWGPTKLMEERVLKYAATPEGNVELTPAYIESYSVNEDSSEFTFTLLKGMKWSDGHAVTTEDVKFWYNDIYNNKEITHNHESYLAPGGKPLTVEILDDRTFTVKFSQPYVYFLNILAQDSTGTAAFLDRPSFLAPAHYLKKFNNHYASAEELAKLAEEYKVEDWTKLWGSKGKVTAWWFNEDLPVITAWKVKGGVMGDKVTMVRNPYYWAVDQEGNQLPYIDTIEHRLFEAQDAFNLMIVQGQIDMQQRYVTANDFTFYKENEEKGGYHVGASKSANVWSLVPNLTVNDEGLRALFENADVRQALSIAIDRETINELAFSGLGEARSASPISGSPYFNAELEAHWTAYDPDKADELLDAAGLDKRDSDGFRLRPDGKRFQIVVENNNDAYNNLLELAADNLRDVGVEMLPRLIDRTQWDDNRKNNNFQMQLIPFDRLSIVPADPRIMMGSDFFANEYFTWYRTGGESGIEPPADHPIRKVWADWDRASSAGSLEEADKATNEMIAEFVNNGWVIGLIGEVRTPIIVKNNFHNLQEGLVEDNITRGIGIARTQQMWIGK